MSIMFRNCFLFCIAAVVMSGCCSRQSLQHIPPECGGTYCKNPDCSIHFIRTAGTGEQIAVQISVLDDSEFTFLGIPGRRLPNWLKTKAELWLKLSHTEVPGLYWLYPLNVEHTASGTKTIALNTPYFISKHRTGKIIVELLDDDRLSNEEIRVLSEGTGVSCRILCDGVNAWVKSYTKKELIKAQTKSSIESLVKDATKISIKNAKAFKSLGYRDYVVVNTGSLFVSNPITICDSKGIARCDIRFHLIEGGAE